MIPAFSAECPNCDEWKYVARINLSKHSDFMAPCPDCGTMLHFTPEELSEESKEDLQLPSDFKQSETCIGEVNFDDLLANSK